MVEAAGAESSRPENLDPQYGLRDGKYWLSPEQAQAILDQARARLKANGIVDGGDAALYGLGAMGEAGVTKALQIIHKELDITMAFCGHTNIQNVNTNILLPGTFPTA